MLLLCLISTAITWVNADIMTDIQTALNLGNSSIEYSRDECIWRSVGPNACPDRDLKVILYNSKNSKGEKYDFESSDWLEHSCWEPAWDNVVLAHGYAGGDNTFPMSMLRDAYLSNGSYNVFVVDWGALSNLPCYPAAVHNVRTAARCVAPVFAKLRDAAPSSTTTTCVGHSLGAHLCGQVGEHLRFRMHRIIGLDPARPLIRNSIKLRPASANFVQVIHSNAGTYGDSGKLGSVDFCLNGGKTQPMCDLQGKTSDLCSHVVSICHMAASINSATATKGYPCARRCPSGPRPTHRIGAPIALGEHSPTRLVCWFSASGFYCVATKKPVYCPEKEGDAGHPWCCLDESSAQQTLETPAPPLTEDSPQQEHVSEQSPYNSGKLYKK